MASSTTRGGRPSTSTALPTFSQKHLRKAMEEAGLDDHLDLQAELMRRFKLSIAASRYLEEGADRCPTVGVLWAIAQVLKKPMEYFLVVRRAA